MYNYKVLLICSEKSCRSAEKGGVPHLHTIVLFGRKKGETLGWET